MCPAFLFACRSPAAFPAPRSVLTDGAATPHPASPSRSAPSCATLSPSGRGMPTAKLGAPRLSSPRRGEGGAQRRMRGRRTISQHNTPPRLAASRFPSSSPQEAAGARLGLTVSPLGAAPARIRWPLRHKGKASPLRPGFWAYAGKARGRFGTAPAAAGPYPDVTLALRGMPVGPLHRGR